MSIFDEFKGLMSDHLKDVRKEMEKSLREVRKDIRSGWNGDDDYYDDNDDIFGRSHSSRRSSMYDYKLPSERNARQVAPPPPPSRAVPKSAPKAEVNNQGLYDPALENLINLALADGELSDKEIAVLFKRAQSMGIDLDEFEMVLQARLFEKQKAMQSESKPKQSTLPPPPPIAAPSVPPGMRKCPACGAVANISERECAYCGYIFPY